jgi:hypothetical protein
MSSTRSAEPAAEASSAPEQYLIAAGNIIDGLRFYGPFNSVQAANDWADDELRAEDWVCGLLNPVSTEAPAEG